MRPASIGDDSTPGQHCGGNCIRRSTAPPTQMELSAEASPPETRHDFVFVRKTVLRRKRRSASITGISGGGPASSPTSVDLARCRSNGSAALMVPPARAALTRQSTPEVDFRYRHLDGSPPPYVREEGRTPTGSPPPSPTPCVDVASHYFHLQRGSLGSPDTLSGRDDDPMSITPLFRSLAECSDQAESSDAAPTECNTPVQQVTRKFSTKSIGISADAEGISGRRNSPSSWVRRRPAFRRHIRVRSQSQADLFAGHVKGSLMTHMSDTIIGLSHRGNAVRKTAEVSSHKELWLTDSNNTLLSIPKVKLEKPSLSLAPLDFGSLGSKAPRRMTSPQNMVQQHEKLKAAHSSSNSTGSQAPDGVEGSSRSSSSDDEEEDGDETEDETEDEAEYDSYFPSNHTNIERWSDSDVGYHRSADRWDESDQSDREQERPSFTIGALACTSLAVFVQSLGVDLSDVWPDVQAAWSGDAPPASGGSSGDWSYLPASDGESGSSGAVRRDNSSHHHAPSTFDILLEKLNLHRDSSSSTFTSSPLSSQDFSSSCSSSPAVSYGQPSSQQTSPRFSRSRTSMDDQPTATDGFGPESHKEKKRRHLMNVLAKRLRANSISVSEMLAASRDRTPTSSGTPQRRGPCPNTLDSPNLGASAKALLVKGPTSCESLGSGGMERVIDRLNAQAKKATKKSGMFVRSSEAGKQLAVLQFNVRHLAEELALIDGEQLRRIRINELENCGWMKKNKEELAPNIVGMVATFNRIALAVTTDILAQSTPGLRARVIQFFVKVAQQCHVLGNYNSLKAILGGLQCVAIHRLSLSWGEVSHRWRRQFKKLTALMSEENNFSSYRSALVGALSSPPCIPFLGVFLSKVVQVDAYLDERAKARNAQEARDAPHKPMPHSQSEIALRTTDHDPVASTTSLSGNESKRVVQRLATVQSELWRFQLASIYQLTSRKKVRDYLMNMPYMSEKESYKRSEALEPPMKRPQ